MLSYKRTPDSRDKALELVENGYVSADDMLVMALKYMSTDDVEDMLDTNELSERFMEEEEFAQATRGLLGYVGYQAILDYKQTSSGPSGPVLTSEGSDVML